jgi:peptidoglycan/LPS O-acetylase OafA/YrhL
MTGQFQSHINGLRALAVIGVVLFHFQLLGIDSGFVGVDIFFVISGYLMTRILFEKESFSKTAYFTEFWMARIRRIAPALVVLTIVCLCIFTTLLLFPDYKKFLRSNVTANLFLSNYFFLVQSSYFDTEADNNPLLHTWSLSLEWQFYLIYPFVVYLLKKRSFAIKLTGLVALMIASYVYCGRLTYTDSTRAYFELMPRVWEFLAGGVVYLVAANQNWFAKVQSSRLTHVSSLLSLCVVLVSMVWVENSIFPGWIAALPVIAAALLILNGQRGTAHLFLSSSPLQIIGNLSYSLYLWHWPIYVYFVMAVAVDKPLSTLEKLTGLLISLGASYVSYKWIEQPIRKKSSHWNSKKVIGFWVVSILISIAALAVVQKSSETSYRLPVYLANAEKARVDKNPRQDECFLDGGKAAARNNDPLLCRIGVNPSNSTDAILWGDSFADAIQPMVEELLTANNLSGVVSTLPGCLPINKVAYVDDAMKRQFSHCDKGLNQKTFEFIAQTPTLKYIIMTANWRRYDTDVLNRDVVQQICKLKTLNRTPILIGPVPSPNYDVPRQWGRMELKQREIIDSMVFPHASSRDVENIFHTLIERIETSCGAVRYIMPSQTYCEKGNCYAVKNGNALFVDNAHLSRTGALMMHDQLEAVLLKNINH